MANLSLRQAIGRRAPRVGRGGPPTRLSRRGAGLRCLCLLGASFAPAADVAADDFVEILTSKVWVRKGGAACGSADAAAEGGTGLFSDCVRLPIAMRVKLIDAPEPMTRVYYMRVLDAGLPPMRAWFSRDSLTNSPRPDEFVPDP